MTVPPLVRQRAAVRDPAELPETATLVVPTEPVPVVVEEVAPPAPAPLAAALATSATLLAVLLLVLVAHVVVVGSVFHAREQRLGYAELRRDLANAVAPVGPARDGALLPLGTPVALLEVPGLGLREVVREGTTSRVLTSGPGHRRDTVLPGQAGTSVLFGRRAAFGGPFGDLTSLVRGDLVRVTTGQGRQEFRVVGVRREGDVTRPLPAGGSRLTLVTAAGRPFLPAGAVRVDADLVGPAQPAPPRVLSAGSLPASERALAGDRSGLVTLLLLCQGLLLAACAVALARVRWGLRQAWVVGTPVLLLLALAVAHSGSALLPNLL